MGEIAIEPLRPKVSVVLCVDDLGAYSNSLCRASDAALDDVTHAQIVRDRPDIGRFVPVGERGMPRDHKQAWHLGQIGYQVLGKSVAKVLLLRVTAHIGK